MIKTIASAAASLFLTAGIASAATVTVDFDSGVFADDNYVENGFTFSTGGNGGVGLANNCPTGSPNSSCLRLNNNEIVTVTYSGGAFDLNSFLFSASGNGGDLNIPGGTVTETASGNNMSLASFTTEYDGIFSFSFQNAANGSGRVDNISFTVAAIPVPAAGLLLLSAFGALVAGRRRKGQPAEITS